MKIEHYIVSNPIVFSMTPLTFCNYNYSGNFSPSAILTIASAAKLKQHYLYLKYPFVCNERLYKVQTSHYSNKDLVHPRSDFRSQIL